MADKVRYPLGTILRDETKDCIYFVIKIEYIENNLVYTLCFLYDPNSTSDKLAFTFIVDGEKNYKLTTLNTNIIVNQDGEVHNELDLMNLDEVKKLKLNTDFMLRYLTACRFFAKSKKHYTVIDVDVKNSTAALAIKTSNIEKFFRGYSYLVKIVSWEDILKDYTPDIPNCPSQEDYISKLKDGNYFFSNYVKRL